MGSAAAAPAEYAERTAESLGASALAAAVAATTEQLEVTKPKSSGPQATLFGEESQPKVIPFSARRPETREELAHDAVPKPKPAPRRKSADDLAGDQTTLDFLPTASPLKSRTLKTTVEAVIYCDAKVAGPLHRAMAAALDAAMILLGVGLFLLIFQIFGGTFPWTKENVALFLGAFGLISMFYGFVWMLAGRETMGMTWADLRIINFNGFPPDRKSRALRMVGCWLSFCSGMIGILWALVDEEGLTWHDHMSKTFPTLREGDSGFIRH